MRVLDPVWRVIRGALLVLAVLVVFIEEFGWRPLSAWLARLAQWPPLHRLEERIRRLPARPALALFAVPAVLLFPLKLIALGMIHAGRTAAGVALIIGVKVVGTAIAGRLFVLLEPQLREFRWFVRALDWWDGVRIRVGAALRESRPWRVLRAAHRQWRVWTRRRFR